MEGFRVSLPSFERRLGELAGQSAGRMLSELEPEILRHKREFVLQHLFRFSAEPLYYAGLSLPADEEQRSKLRSCLYALWYDVSIAPCGKERELLIVHTVRTEALKEHLIRLKQLAAYFKLRFYPDLDEDEIRFEEGSLCCDNLKQCAPISMTGMLGAGLFKKVRAECAGIDATQEDLACLKRKAEDLKPAGAEICAHRELTEALRRALRHDSYKTAVVKMLRTLFPKYNRELLLGNVVQRMGEDSYLGFSLPQERRNRESLYLKLLERGLVLSCVPYGKSIEELLIVQKRKGQGEFSAEEFSSAEALASASGVKLYHKLKLRRIRFEQARELCRCRI